MWIQTPGSHDLAMINLCNYQRVNVVENLAEVDVWELRAYTSMQQCEEDEGVCIKSGDYEELESLMVALKGTLRHPSFALTTPTFH